MYYIHYIQNKLLFLINIHFIFIKIKNSLLRKNYFTYIGTEYYIYIYIYNYLN